jgi:proline dehydrogenase
MLLGLGTDLLDRLHRDGYRAREYVIFGGEWWLYASTASRNIPSGR